MTKHRAIQNDSAQHADRADEEENDRRQDGGRSAASVHGVCSS
jgi:hypothetical protein